MQIYSEWSEIYNIWWIAETELAYFMVYLTLDGNVRYDRNKRHWVRWKERGTFIQTPHLYSWAGSIVFFFFILYWPPPPSSTTYFPVQKLRAWINLLHTKCRPMLYVVSLIVYPADCICVCKCCIHTHTPFGANKWHNAAQNHISNWNIHSTSRYLFWSNGIAVPFTSSYH